jgi:hypothetical protein
MKRPDTHTAALPLPPAPGEYTTHDALAFARATCPSLRHLNHDTAMAHPTYNIVIRCLAESVNRRRAAEHGVAAHHRSPA